MSMFSLLIINKLSLVHNWQGPNVKVLDVDGNNSCKNFLCKVLVRERFFLK